MNEKSIFFFDGKCGLCNRSVDFILKYDLKKKFHFATLQHEKSINFFLAANRPSPDFSTTILFHRGEFYEKSDVYFVVLKEFGFPWTVLSFFKIFPKLFRDLIYDLVSKNRNRFFGVTETCRVPTPEERERFIHF